MQRAINLRGALLLAAALVAGVVAAVYATRSNGAGSGARARVVMTAHNSALNATILVDRRGRSLYSLSAEHRGKFICTDMACLALWKPLVVARGTKPTGVAGLSVTKRPDSRGQVAFHGRPLYRFANDAKSGDVKGNGFKDVGVWRVVTLGTSHASSPPPSTPSYPGRY
jgi:predicted lipoprotein with Yx(FWY)xxD motif